MQQNENQKVNVFGHIEIKDKQTGKVLVKQRDRNTDVVKESNIEGKNK